MINCHLFIIKHVKYRKIGDCYFLVGRWYELTWRSFEYYTTTRKCRAFRWNFRHVNKWIDHQSKNIPQFLLENHENAIRATHKTPLNIFSFLQSSLTNGRNISETHFLIEYSIYLESWLSIVISIFVTVIFDGRCLVSKQRMLRKRYANLADHIF